MQAALLAMLAPSWFWADAAGGGGGVVRRVWAAGRGGGRQVPSATMMRTWAAMLGALVCCAFVPVARAQPARSAVWVRWGAAGAFMLSRDQRSWLHYNRPGLLGDLQLAYRVGRWLDLQLGATGGVFFSGRAGGLAAPALGATWRWTRRSPVPYVAIDVGTGFTGKILRPFGRAGVGVDFGLSRRVRVGPTLGVGVVVEPDSSRASTDAIFAWAGLSMSYAVVPAAQSPGRVAARTAPVQPELLPAVEPARTQHPPPAPSPELEQLLDQALPRQRSELLAPVLFALDSDALEPTGVAMLHEVARVLMNERRDIELLEIEGYADARGSATHNVELAQRRAERVRAWLVEHGIAPERLLVKGHGATDPVEPGRSEADYEQNRRVVFRVLRKRSQ